MATKKPTSTPTTATLTPRSSTAGTLVLQWLTYAFWGWFIGALTWLIGVLLTNALLGEAVNTILPYAIAATVVLFPLAFVCDFFYRKHEPLRKAGAAMVIMLIHAVIFALIAIGSLIVAVFTGLNSIINATDDSASVTGVVVYTAASTAVLFGLAFLRTLNPFKQKRGATVYALGMLGLTIALLIATIAGPVVQSFNTRNDRIIEESLSSIHYGVQNYVFVNDRLPASLNDIKVSSEKAEQVIADGAVEYINDGPAALESNPEITSHRYQLCVEYDYESKGERYESNYADFDVAEYKTYPSATPHEAGRVCYKLAVEQ